MSRKAKKANRKRQPRPSPKPVPSGANTPERSDLSVSDRKIAISPGGSQLTPRQRAVLPVLAISPSIAQAARDTGVSARTIRRWLDDSEFREQLSLLHEASYDIARSHLQALVPHFLSVSVGNGLPYRPRGHRKPRPCHPRPRRPLRYGLRRQVLRR